MKRHLTLAIAMMILVAAAATTAYSQSSSATTMRARIPFAFHAGSKELPAGEYNLRVLNPSSDQKALQIRSVDGRVSAIVRAFDVNASAAEKSKLVFHRYGDTYFFAQAQVAGELTTLAAIKSGAERSQERMLARNNKQKLNVAIAAE
jgi:hypothetical protein